MPSIVIEELRYGFLRLPDGKRRDAYADMVDVLVESYADEILPYDARAAWTCAALRWLAHSSGLHPSVQDMMIAAIAQVNGASLVTRNIKDFSFLASRFSTRLRSKVRSRRIDAVCVDPVPRLPA